MELKYLYGGVSQYHSGEKLWPRRILDYELFFILEGTATYSVNGLRYAVGPNMLIMVRPGTEETLEWVSCPRAWLFYLHFDIAAMPSGWPEGCLWPTLVCDPPVATSHFMHSIIQRLPAEMPPNPPSRHITCLLEALIGEVLLDSPPLAARWPDPVARAIHRMRQVFNQPPPKTLTLAELARAAGVTCQHLSRLFLAHFGMPPIHMLGLMRLQCALALLSHTTLSVGVIADRCGFENQSYFSRRFTAHFGMSPSRVRDVLREGMPCPRPPLPLDVMPHVYWGM